MSVGAWSTAEEAVVGILGAQFLVGTGLGVKMLSHHISIIPLS